MRRNFATSKSQGGFEQRLEILFLGRLKATAIPWQSFRHDDSSYCYLCEIFGDQRSDTVQAFVAGIDDGDKRGLLIDRIPVKSICRLLARDEIRANPSMHRLARLLMAGRW